MSQTDRIHGFDTLRAFALLLGIVLHAIMPYILPSLEIWFVLDDNRHFGYTVLLVTIHAFRLQTFFLLAGFFSSLLIEKRGLVSFIKNRMQRVLVPLILSVLILVPLMQWLMVIGYSMRDGAGYVEIGSFIIDTRAYNTSVADFFQSGKFIGEVFLYHIWFLYYLAMIYVAFVGVRQVILKLALTESLHRLGRWVIKNPGGFLLPILVSTCFMWPMRLWQVDTPYTIIPEGLILGYYFVLFVVGVAIHRNSDLLDLLQRRCKFYLGIAVLVLPLMLYFQSLGPNPFGREVSWNYKPLALISYNVFTWLVVLGLIGGFTKWSNQPSRRLRLVSETAYWQYLLHLPLLVGMQIGLNLVCWPSFVEITLQCVIGFLVLYYLYVGWLGRTFVGRLLNGRTIDELDETK